MDRDELIEFIKRAEEFPITGDKRSSIRAKNSLRVMIKDSKRGYVVGEINYVEKNRNFYYSKKDNGEIIKLSYSNLEKIFINNRKD